MENTYCYGCMQHVEDNGSVCPLCGFDPSAYTCEPHQLMPGTMLHERYMVGRVLGEGGFGITYVGRDTVLDMKVAVKEFYMSGYVNRNNTYSTVVQASVGTHEETFEKNKEKFLTEARALARFADEDGIVGIRDFFQENNTAYIVMDFLNGQTLKDYLQEKGKLSVDETMELLGPVLLSLSHVHEHDVIHRDISPDNIMITNDHKVKLLDFGAAREISKNDIKSLSVILKPGYAPEEQYRSKGNQGPWTDVYALCATIYRCLTGVVPDDSMERMFDDRLVPPAEMGVCSQAFSNVLMKGLAVRQPDRYQSIEELREGFRIARSSPEAVTAIPQPVRRDRTVQTQDTDATVYARTPEELADQTVYADDMRTQSANNNGRTVPSYTPPKRPNPPILTPPQPPKQPKKKKTGLIVALIAVAALAVIGLGLALIIGKLKGGNQKGGTSALTEMPAPFDTYSFTLNDQTIKLPTTFRELEKKGWVPEDSTVLDKKVVANNSYAGHVELTNGYGSFEVYYVNPTNNTLSVSECPINEIHMSHYGLTHNYLNEVRNHLKLSNGLVFGESREEDFLSSCPGGYTKKKDGVYNEYRYTVKDEGEAVLRFEKDKKVWSIFYITCENTEGMVKNSYETKMPDYGEDVAEAIRFDWQMKQGDSTYAVSVPVDYYLKQGWEIEKAPEYLASGTADKVYLRWNTTTTLVLNIYNPFNVALVPRYCMVSDVNLSPNDGEIELICPSGEVISVSRETTKADFKTIMERQSPTRMEIGTGDESDKLYFTDNKCYLEAVYYKEADGSRTLLIIYFQALKGLQEAYQMTLQ